MCWTLSSLLMRMSSKSLLYQCNDMPEELAAVIIKQEHQITKASFISLLSFVLLYLPCLVFHMIFPRSPGLLIAGDLVFWSSTFINPCIYVVSISKFKSAFTQTFGFLIRCDVILTFVTISQTLMQLATRLTNQETVTEEIPKRNLSRTEVVVCYSDDRY